jgi:TRIAD3 protein (E3 ubiquitin-protein ligase RNF216)
MFHITASDCSPTFLGKMDKKLLTTAEATDISTLSSSSLGDPLEIRLDRSPQHEVAQQHFHTKNETNLNTVSDCVARVLEIIPDVKPDHVTKLVTDTIQIYGTGAVERVLLTLFDDPRHPKVQHVKRDNRKEGSNGTDEGSPLGKVNFGVNYDDHNRPRAGGPNYATLTLVRPFVPVFPFFDLRIQHRNIFKRTSLLFQ